MDTRCEIVTEFLLNTCTPVQLNPDAVNAMPTSVEFATRHQIDRYGVAYQPFVPLVAGSVAELYILPMLSCVDDADVMVHFRSELAIPRGTLPPTCLPEEFHSRVVVCVIIDSADFPGYLYLVTSYLLTESGGFYNAEQCRPEYRATFTASKGIRHGPALVTEQEQAQSSFVKCVTTSYITIDAVLCVRCLSWPSQAADWPIRHRNYGWPDSTTVDRVVSNGCDVVQVAHRQCIEDEWMSQHQWRLSFSRAEVVLINSWMPVQQIVYHMLRCFVKIQRLTHIKNNTGARILSNYNVKTLMLWACELKPRSWWTDDVNIVRICVELLHTLAVWLTDARCKHYFINNCNLFDSLDMNSQATYRVANELQSITETWLAEWFIHIYMHKCVLTCYENVPRLLVDNVRTTTYDLQEVVADVVQWKLDTTHKLSWHCFTRAQLFIISTMSKHSLTVQLYSVWMTELAKLDRDLFRYFTAVTFLHVACKTTRKLLEDDLLDVLATTCLQSNDLRRCRNARHGMALSLSQAAILMKAAANNSRSTVQLIEIELSKAYLYRALRIKDCDNEYYYCKANAYLAVLYYTRGQYQTAMDLCTLVTRPQDYSLCLSHFVTGELLPKIDDNIDNALGLVVFYEYVKAAALNQQRTPYVGVLTTQLFAHYLRIRCLPESHSQCYQLMPTLLADGIQEYQICFHESSVILIADALLFKSVRGTKYPVHRTLTFIEDRQKPMTSGHLDTSELVELLKKSAVEHLTAFRELEAQKFGSVAAIASKFSIVTTDYEALYAYKRCEYQRSLRLSTHNVRTLIGRPASISLIFAYPEFIQLMDDDIVSLTGLMMLVNPSCRELRGHFSTSQLSLSLYLMAQCQMKLHHSVTSLHRTLTCIDVARRKVDTLDQLLLKLTEQKIYRYMQS